MSTGDIPCHWMVRVVRVTIINGDVNSQQQWQKHPGDGDTDTLVRPDLSQRIPNQTHQAVTFYSWRDLRLVIFITGGLWCQYTEGVRCLGLIMALQSPWLLRAQPMWAKLLSSPDSAMTPLMRRVLSVDPQMRPSSLSWMSVRDVINHNHNAQWTR